MICYCDMATAVVCTVMTTVAGEEFIAHSYTVSLYS